MKNKIAKISFIILSIVLVLSTCMTVFALTTSSFTNSENGLVATLSFNKQSYNANENIGVSLNVQNNNSYIVKNIQTQIILPSGIKSLNSNLTSGTFSLNAGENKVQEVSLAKVVDTKINEPITSSPQTGDNVAIYIAMMVVSVVALVVIAVKKKWIYKKKVMSLVLCLLLVGTMTLTSVVNAEPTIKEFTVEGTIKVDGEDVVIKGKVTYTHEIYSKLQIDGTDKGMYVEGDTVTITAEDAPEGKHFVGWTVVKGNVTLADKNSSTTTFIMGTEEVEIKANYEVNTYTIEVTSGENGKISPAGNVSVEYGKGQTFTVTADEGYHIDSITIDGQKQHNYIGVGNIWKNETIRFTNVKENHTLAVTFAIDTFTITSTANAGGTITETATVDYGSSKTFTITPNTGYHIENVEVDGVNKGKIDTYTFTDVKEKHTIDVTFAIDTFTITTKTNDGGSITGNTTVNYNDNTTFTITPNTGYGIVDVKVDGISIGATTSYEFKNVVKSHAIEVIFGVTTEESFKTAVNKGGNVYLADNINLGSIFHEDSNVKIYGGDYKVSGSRLMFQSGNASIESGYFNEVGIYISNYYSHTGYLAINGGYIENIFVDYRMYNSFTLEINAGTIKNIYGNFDIDVSISIKGGTFYFDPTSYVNTVTHNVTKTTDADDNDIWVVTEK